MEDVLTQLTRQFLPQMTAAEKSRALRSLKALIDAELFDLAASEGGGKTIPTEPAPGAAPRIT